MPQSLIDRVETARQIGGNKPVSISFVNPLLARKLLPRVRISYRLTRIPQAAVSGEGFPRDIDANRTYQ
jgi:hypothetical protein